MEWGGRSLLNKEEREGERGDYVLLEERGDAFLLVYDWSRFISFVYLDLFILNG